MAKIFECKMSTTYIFKIKADSESEADFWLRTHYLEDVEKETSEFDVSYGDEIIGEVLEEEDRGYINISEEN